jgi:riboflavin kinase/FMN adenylyltransferase
VQVVRTPTDLPASLKRSVVAIGNFDGVHLGHARIVERLKARGAELNAPTLIFTFDPHPLSLLRPEASPLPLTWLERKIALLEELGVDGVLVYPTNSTLLSLSAEAFFQQIILDSLQSRGLVEGPNFYFGRGRSGNIEFLRGKCEQLGLAFEVVEPFTKSGELISSSRVRELIQAGRIGAANQSLTRPYRLRGSVGRGAARGRTIGFPTANLEGVETVVPGPGVYIARAYVEQVAWPAAVNIGPNPTFGEQAGKIEVHLVGFQGDLYDRTLEVEFLDRLRDVQTFASVHELIDQLRRDVAEVCETCACMKS